MIRPNTLQLEALRLIAAGGVTVREFGPRKNLRVHGPDGTNEVWVQTMWALENHGWTTRDFSYSLAQGQPLVINPSGQAFVDEAPEPDVEADPRKRGLLDLAHRALRAEQFERARIASVLMSEDRVIGADEITRLMRVTANALPWRRLLAAAANVDLFETLAEVRSALTDRLVDGTLGPAGNLVGVADGLMVQEGIRDFLAATERYARPAAS
ncbi:hypothetical protein PV341_31100 [Streptomyces sp. PA03-1a]|nr:hypothetical protein [Streptomyces sp. PA03-1a]MDX2813394.1 hypothetical protein [Streptomyces sp. PA03-5A]